MFLKPELFSDYKKFNFQGELSLRDVDWSAKRDVPIYRIEFLSRSLLPVVFLILFYSVIMTTASVVFAFGMMPLNLFIYSRSWTDDKSVIPYKDIFVTLVAILIPVCAGVIIRYKLKKLAPVIVKVGIGKYFMTLDGDQRMKTRGGGS